MRVKRYDVIIIGGGPAGLSAAVVLGRCRRNVLLIDARRPRNRFARRMHNFLTRDGIAPARFLAIGRREAARSGVEMLHATAAEARCLNPGFEVRLEDGTRHRCKRLVLATGVRDTLPRLKNIDRFYGISVHHCPYCDGHTWRDRALVAYGPGRDGAGLALSLLSWSADVTLCCDGEYDLSAAEAARLRRKGIKVRREPIGRLIGRGGKLRGIAFEKGPELPCDALFFNTGQRQQSDLAGTLGCRFDNAGSVVTDDRERTSVGGLFLVGDASRDVQFVIAAAAEGAVAGVTINKELQAEEGRTLPPGRG